MKAGEEEELLARLKNIEGHLRGISRMVERNDYCIDIIRQVLAVQRALDRVNSLILGGHLETCVTTAIRAEDPEARTKVLGELVEIFNMANKL